MMRIKPLIILLIFIVFLVQSSSFHGKITAQTFIVDINRWGAFLRIPTVSISDVSHNVYPISKGLEWEINISKLPSVNRFDFQIQTKDLEFFYQPPLTEDQLNFSRYTYVNDTHAMIGKKRGIYRPENVVGSYAVFHSYKMGNEFQTGKICHIYRPFAYDAKNLSTWVEMTITKTVLTLSIPWEFLYQAVYPVCIDPTFGYDSMGGTSWDNDINEKFGAQYAVPEDATIHNVTVGAYMDTDDDYYGCFYNDQGDNTPDTLNVSVLRDDIALGGPYWHTFDTADFSAESGALLWLTILTTQYTEIMFDTASTYYSAWDSNDPPPPNSNFNDDTIWSDRHFSFFANYTAAAGPTEYSWTLYEHSDVDDSMTGLRERSTILPELVLLYAAFEGLRERGLIASETVLIFSQLISQRELSHVVSETVLIYVNLTFQRELLEVLVERSGLVRIYENMTGLRELSVEVSETLFQGFRTYANMTFLREILVEVSETLFGSLRINDALVSATEIIITVSMVLALAAIALVIALAAFAYAASKRDR